MHEPEINNYSVIGLMSGTSLDGIDLAVITFTKKEYWTFKLGTCVTYAYSEQWIERLSNLTTLSQSELTALDEDYTRYLGEQVQQFCQAHQLSKDVILCSHGHTALHQPERGITHQLGNLPELARWAQRQVVCDFRTQDVALGGQGAPLVPIGDRLLFSSYAACVNLGGFANISRTKNDAFIAYDICAVNTVLNPLANRLNLPYDPEGQNAEKGQLLPELFDTLEDLAFYQTPAPKSLGIEWVFAELNPLLAPFKDKPVEDVLHTYTQHVAQQIAAQLPSTGKVLFTGGGAFNRYLMQCIQARTSATLEVPDPLWVSYKEALVFGLLGVLKLRGEVNCLAAVTGASKDHSSGRIFFP